jgi:hypothetical protein
MAIGQMELPYGQPGGKWLNSPVTVYRGNPWSIRQLIPDFERRSFGLHQPNTTFSRLNERLDVIVRTPNKQDDTFVPIGVVSKDYRLVPHKAVFDAATETLVNNNMDPAAMPVELALTRYGERMRLSVFLPAEYDFDPGDGYPMAMRLECFNSVERSTRFKALIGWFRFVCCNGLIIGVTRTNFQHRHAGDLSIADIAAVLKNGLEETTMEKERFKKWRARIVQLENLVPWIEKDVAKTWGFKAATRTYHIASSGWDVEIAGAYKDESPTTIQVRTTRKVPGSPHQVENAYDVSQVLAWLAKERNDVQEQLEWRQQIPGLMKALLNNASLGKSA